MWQATLMLVETMRVMQGYLDDAQAAGHDVRESGKGKDANYTVVVS